MTSADAPTILIINDEPGPQRVAQVALERAGMRTRCFASADEALVHMRQHGAPDVIVTDLYMPGIDGWRFCQLLRSAAYASFNEVPVLVVSAVFTGSRAEQVSAELGADGFLPIPHNPRELVERVQSLLGARPARVGFRALIVEDAASQARTCQTAFEAAGYDVVVAADGEEARRLFAERTPEVAVIDYHLPDVDGDVLLEELKAAEPAPVVLMVTADETPELALDLTRKGADGYVRKPFDPRYVVTLCDRARRERALLHAEALLKQRDRELRQSEREKGLILGSMSELVAYQDTEHRVRWANRAAGESVGLTPEQLVGRRCYEIWHGREEPCQGCPVARAVETGEPQEAEVITPDGRVWLIRGEPARDSSGTIVGAVEVTRDITEERRAQAALVAESAFRRSIIARAGEGLCVCHAIDEFPHVVFTVWNDRMTEITGYTMEEINRLGWYQTMYPDPEVRARVVERMERMRDGEDLLSEEWTIARKDGQPRALLISTTILESAEGAVHVLAVMHDATERKRAEARTAAFAGLGQRLSAANTMREAAQTIVDTAEELLGWDAALVATYDRERDRVDVVLALDLVDGRRTVTSADLLSGAPSSRMREILDGKPRLHLRQRAEREPGFTPFGDVDRPAMSLMYVPIRHGEAGEVEGFLSLQSYTRDAYTEEDLATLQAFADHCGGALDRVLTHEALRSSEATERALLDASPHYIFLLSLDGVLLALNEPAARSFGRRPDDLIGERAAGLFDSDAAAQRRLHFEEVVRTGKPVSFETERDGRWHAVRVHPVFDDTGEVARVAVYAHDITEHRQMQTALANERDLLQALMDNLPDTVYFKDTESRFTRINRAQAELLGLADPADAVGNTDFDFFEHAPEARRDEEKILATGKPLLDKLEKIRGADGVPRWISTTKAPICSREGKVAGLVGVSRDVTERVQAQRHLERQERLAAVGQLAAGIAHDFNNRLMGIVGNADLLLLREGLPEEALGKVRIIQEEGMRAAVLVRQLLDFTRKSIVDVQALDLASLVKEAEELLSATLEEHVRLTVTIEPGSYPVKGDSGQLHEVLTNLALNARDAMPDGGALAFRLSLLDLPAGVTPPCPEMPPGRWAVLTAQDTGAGMPPEVRDRVFEPFFTTKDIGKGTGLGLAQVYGIVEQHAGFIDVQSEVGVGSTFTLYLPLAEQAEATGEEPVPEAPPSGAGETVLVVEDERLVREMLRDMVEALNYTVLTASNGREALEVHGQHAEEIAAVLTDMVMPEMGGRELCRALRQRDPDLEVVLLTGYPYGSDPAKLAEEGFFRWMQKPPTMAALGAALRQAVARRTGGPGRWH